tara:strand:+ start:11852 stop:12064 length:213 start_codon:yes stop_codon:yes gene_type:complete
MRDKEDIRWMLDEAIVRRNEWKSWLAEIRQDPSTSRKQIAEAIRNFNAMNGVVKSLQWVLEFPGIDHPLN